jgi:Fis family transcriptional regulator, factor for inversion stimulation protein
MDPLQAAIKQAITQYFLHLEGSDANNIYDLMLTKVERPLLETVMQHAGNNQSKAAQWLGLSRNTLRKLLEKYNL